MEKSINFKYIIPIIMFLFLFTNCEYNKTKNLSRKINLKEVISENDSVDFFIQQIILYDTKIPENIISPIEASIGLFIKIKNKTDQSLYFEILRNYRDYTFISVRNNDTTGFLNGFGENKFILSPYKDTLIEVGSTYYPFFEITKYDFKNKLNKDNTKEIIKLVEQMDFYYIPHLATIPKHFDSSVTILRNKYPLGISKKTKVISRNQVYFP